jgi:hypothetical protein
MLKWNSKFSRYKAIDKIISAQINFSSALEKFEWL